MRRISIIVLALTVFGASNALAAQKLIRMAGFTPEKSVVVTHTMKPFIKAVNAEVGDEVKVKVLGIDDRGKVRLSMKVVDQATGNDISEDAARPEQAVTSDV